MTQDFGVKQIVRHLWFHYPITQNLGDGLLAFIIMTIAGIALLTFVLIFAQLAVWAERKVSGHIQDRLGPMRTGWHGWLQSLADGIKLMLKEDIIPTMADKPLFLIAPCLVFLTAFTGYTVIPFSERAQIANLDIGVLFVLAVTGLGVIGVIMAGWASNSKWPLYGAMRSAAVVVSYGVPLGLSIIPALIIAGSLSMQDIVQSQSGGLLHWNISRFWPFMPLAFIVFYLSALAETNRVPFDVAEAESELVGGYHTEYSGVMFSLFFLAEYCAMYLSCCVGTVLFLGGYVPPNFSSLGLFGLPRLLAWLAVFLFLFWRFKTFKERRQLSEAVFFAILTLASLFVWKMWPHFFWFTAKAGALFYLMLWLRWTLPRIRIDQLMYMCWKVLTPLAFINLIGVSYWLTTRYQ